MYKKMYPDNIKTPITLAEVMKVHPLNLAEVIAGKSGLDRVVNFVAVMEVPNLIHLVQKGELLFTTGYPLREQEDLLSTLIQQLSEKGLVGLGIKPIYIDPIPQFLIDDANRYNFPLLKLPLNLVLTDIIRPLMVAIDNRRAGILEYSTRVYETLTQLVMQGQGLKDIASSLSNLVENPVAFIDEFGQLQVLDPSIMDQSDLTSLLDARFEKKKLFEDKTAI